MKKISLQKKAQVTIFVIVGIFLVGAIVLLSWLKTDKVNPIDEIECNTPDDCIPNECCNARLCVPKTEALNCANVVCDLGCDSFNKKYLGCGAGTIGEGSCECVNHKCTPYFP